MKEHPATSRPFDAKIFDFARNLARQGKEVPGSAFLMLEEARQYHMDQINRLQSFLAVGSMTSEEVVDCALKRIFPHETPRSETPRIALAGPTEYRDGVLEEAAKACEQFVHSKRTAIACAAAIRKLKLLPAPTAERTPSATPTIDKLAALMVGAGVDVDICPPGNHGGRGADADKWLVTLMPPNHHQILEFFGATLDEAIMKATR